MPNGKGMGYMGPPDDDEMEDSETETEESTEMEGKSALLPKSLFKGEVKPGSKITLTVDAVYNDEVECSVASNETETEKPQMMSANEELDSMAGEEMA